MSWYEASAYCEFARKSLPDVYHWYNASGPFDVLSVLPLSNFSGKGTMSVGASGALGPYGTYDMAGNVKEWALNPSDEKRYILGGGWDETNYEFTVMDAQSPFERGESFGFRCARYDSPLTEELAGPVPQTARDRTHDEPVDDEAFKVLESLYSYDKTDLKATVDSVSEEPHWRRENVSFQAAYGTERVIAHLYLPKNADPPYQAVIYYPNLTALFVRNPDDVIHVFMEDIIKSGRALILPAYKGTLERGPTSPSTPSNQMRDLSIQGAKDLRRTVDYLETRSDIDSGRLGYLGLSLGAVRAPIDLVIEPRFKAAILLSSCAYEKLQPEVDPWNFAPRLRTPVLMLNGRNDFYCPVEAAQLPLFRALGTPSQDKRHVVYEGSHVDFINRLEVVKEALDWLERYLGPVKLRP